MSIKLNLELGDFIKKIVPEAKNTAQTTQAEQNASVFNGGSNYNSNKTSTTVIFSSDYGNTNKDSNKVGQY